MSQTFWDVLSTMNGNGNGPSSRFREDVMGAFDSLQHPSIVFQQLDQVPALHELIVQPFGCAVNNLFSFL